MAPNRVLAYNQLGYLEMGQGRFADAQKMFETYRYIAHWSSAPPPSESASIRALRADASPRRK